ncbi:MAG: hypothetical protein ACR2HR_09915 [Euzebya sp.]
MSGFDRIKPPEKRLLERDEARQPDSGQADPHGRAALFSVAEEPSTPGAGARSSPHGIANPADTTADTSADTTADTSADTRTTAQSRSFPTGGGPVKVECGHCGISCQVSLTDALKKAIPMMVVAPWKSHPVFATCPCGERRAWLKPGLGLPG